MRYLFSVLLFVLLSPGLHAQPDGAAEPDPVKWSISASGSGDPLDVVIHAVIEHGWSVYSQNNYGDMGPWPTSITIDPLPGVKVLGKATETGGKVIEGMDEVFGMEVKKFKGTATFTQKISLQDPNAVVTGQFEYMTCNDVMCLPPTTVFFRLTPSTNTAETSGFPFKDEPAVAVQQVDEPVEWSLTTEKVKPGTWYFRFTATVAEHWAVYSQESFGDGPIPTRLALDSTVQASFNGPAKEESDHMQEGMDEMFGITVRKFKHEVSFVQEVVVPDENEPITGKVDYMACNDSQCIFPDPVPFSVDLSTGLISIGSRTVEPGGECKYKLSTVDLDAPVMKASNEVSEVRENASLWRIFFLGFVGGLVALLTPCVFPMIPLTVSFFTKG
ncbi:MAG: hypothetical protein KDB84_05705, partial [Flavobacteriales bacterium]|nr:hypothetical protein [Flavobacteriales bacterium]